MVDSLHLPLFPLNVQLHGKIASIVITSAKLKWELCKVTGQINGDTRFFPPPPLPSSLSQPYAHPNVTISSLPYLPPLLYLQMAPP